MGKKNSMTLKKGMENSSHETCMELNTVSNPAIAQGSI
jgi:hypothetical protein